MKIETLAIKDLTPDPQNARQHDTKNLKAIEGSLAQFGQRKPIVITEANVIVAGNGTVAAAKNLGWEKIEAVRVPSDWSKDQVKAFALADNRTAELATWAPEVLAAQLIELESAGFEIAEFGFDKVEPPINPDLIADDNIPELPLEPTTKLGDVWKLGRHRLICGDSNDQDVLDALLEGKKLDAIIQDPPYGVLPVEWDRPLSQTDLDVALDNCTGPIFMFNATKPNLFRDVLNLEPQADRIMVWRMTAGITGKGGLFWTWQPVFVWNANKQMIGWDSVEFESASPDRTGEHLTQKPIGLIRKYMNAIPNCKTVGDFFLGSGTTLLAAELENKTCFGIEYLPKYCDVIVKRWENLTGQKAELVNATR
jgi:site-specific DNA-methyltransferase (adenine-specific)